MRSLKEIIKALEICSLPEGCSREGCPLMINSDIAEKKGETDMVCCIEGPNFETGDLIPLNLLKDALEYLKEYQDKYSVLDEMIYHNREMADEPAEVLVQYMRGGRSWLAAKDRLYQIMEDAKSNPEVSWETLLHLEGQPVWIEMLSDEVDVYSKWMLTGKQTEAGSIPMTWVDDMIHWIFLHKEEEGTIWRAYRKEVRNDIL